MRPNHVLGIFTVGYFTVGYFTVGHFTQGHFAVRTLRREEFWTLDFLLYGFLSVHSFGSTKFNHGTFVAEIFL